MWRTPAIDLLRRVARPATALRGPAYRLISGGGGGDAKAMSHAEAKRLMRLANVEALKEKLGKEDREVIPYDELLKVCRTMGVASTTDDAAAFARVLDDAGVVLLFRDKVYLHPDKVVDLVRKAVPLAMVAEEEAEAWKAELQKLQEKKEEIDMAAHKQVRRILWTGLGLAVVQVGLFFRLTFWEFSWDVMEPIAFFTTSAGIVIGYAYFMFTSRDPSYQDLLMRLFLSRQRKLIKTHNFDIVRFVQLQKHCRTPQYTCASVKRRIGIDVDPDDLLPGHSNQN
ncbi:calcium uniporter protein 5, mitochondrial-like [Salvia miltiorrhiza]|uniref:calcium uniporter protein 5, mitochondrial-like n=1 Tax=Salvia miltiorrhiza TaxID=226208 RepID=UPI0025AC44D6|nr:calcium uniporter protein 5, mitochondrial-like [Salvia miltiorrhiza]